jgi:hypothetical protein
MLIQPSKNSIKMIIIDNLDSGKLILIDKDVNHMSRDMAFVEVARQTDIPIFATRERAFHLNNLAGCTVAWYTEADILSKGKYDGFMADISIETLRIYTLMNSPIQSPNFRFRTGLHINDIFSHDIITRYTDCEPNDHGDCGCPTPITPVDGCPTPYEPDCPTPSPGSGCPTPQHDCKVYQCFKPLFDS